MNTNDTNNTDADENVADENADTELTLEPDADADNAKDAAAALAALKEKLKICQKERQEYLDGWQRMKADFANAKKRENEERSEFVKFSKEDIIRELLPALTSFHTAFGDKDAWEKVDLNWRMGVQYIYSQLRGALERHGITLIEPRVGEQFDAEKHESIGTESVAEKGKDHTILVVVSKGYALHGKILEPAKVMVGEYADKSEARNSRPSNGSAVQAKSEANVNEQNQK